MITRTAFLAIVALCWSTARAGTLEDTAATTAKSWLMVLDSGQYEQCWKEAADVFRSAISREKWAQTLKSNRASFGVVQSRYTITAEHREDLPGAPAGRYVVVRFSTIFKDGTHPVETVYTKWEGESWHVSGYFFRPSSN